MPLIGLDCKPHQVLRLSPNDPAAAYNRANALKVDGKLDEALYWYRGALKADPKDVSKVH